MKIRLTTVRTKDGRDLDLFLIELSPDDVYRTGDIATDVLAPLERHGLAAVATIVPIEDER